MSNIFDLFKKIESQSPSPTGSVEYIIAGLGNPGSEYESTRHNVGFCAMDHIADKLSVKVNRSKFHSLTADAMLHGHRVLLMKPQLFMNRSGEAIRDAAAFYKIPPENVVIIYDDISLEVGKMRIRRKGSDGGHNGIKDIIYHLQSQDFPRIKIGVGNPASGAELVGWLLGEIPRADREKLEGCLKNSYEALEYILAGNIDRAMNLYN